MSKPFFLLIPGSFALPEFYDGVVEAIAASGVDIKAIHLPSVGLSAGAGRPGPPSNMYDDAAFIAEHVKSLADEGREVILIAHSYGGIPTTESTKGLSKSERQKQGKEGGVVRIAFVSVLVPAVGATASDVLANTPEDQRVEMRPDESGWLCIVDQEYAAAKVFNDLPKEEGEAWIAKFPQQSAASFVTPLTHAGYVDVPVSYLVCEHDLTMPAKLQREQIEMIENKSGRKVDVTAIKTGHCPMASQPQLMIDWVLQLAAGESDA